jgi:hypothetical protein
MAWKVGAEGTRYLESQGIPAGGRVGERKRCVPDGPTHAINTETAKVACGLPIKALTVFPEDWESASFIEKCPDCAHLLGVV